MVGLVALLAISTAQPGHAETGSCPDFVTFPPPLPALLDRTADQPAGPPLSATQRAAYTAAAAKAVQQQAAVDWPDLCRYRAADQTLLQRKATVSTVFLGDSITQYWSVADPGPFTLGLVNRGIAGQISGQMLVRLRQDVIALHPRSMVLLAGTNDIMALGGATTVASIEDNIASMAQLAQANHIGIVLATVPPLGQKLFTAARRAAQTDLNAWLARYARDQATGLVDFSSALSDKQGFLDPQLSMDPVHPNRRGYSRMRKLVLAALHLAKN
jgi:lysophospholipase L1-like esterase